MTIEAILLILAIVVLVGAIPAWPHSRGWGYWPSGTAALFLVVLLLLLLAERI